MPPPSRRRGRAAVPLRRSGRQRPFQRRLSIASPSPPPRIESAISPSTIPSSDEVQEHSLSTKFFKSVDRRYIGFLPNNPRDCHYLRDPKKRRAAQLDHTLLPSEHRRAPHPDNTMVPPDNPHTRQENVNVHVDADVTTADYRGTAPRPDTTGQREVSANNSAVPGPSRVLRDRVRDETL